MGEKGRDVLFRLAVGVFALVTNARAAGTTGASFLDIPTGAGPASMGSAYTALATDAYAPVWNPAGLGFLETPQIAGQHLSYLESIHDEFLAGVYPLRPGKSIGFSAQYLGSGDITGTDTSGANTGTYSDMFAAYALAYGQAINEKLAFGLTGKLIHGRLDDVTANAYAADFGTLYKLSDRINLGASLANVGSHLTFLNSGDSLPLTFRLGGSYQPTPHWTLTSDFVAPKSEPLGLHFGGEWKPIALVGIRAGYRTDTTKGLSALAGFSTGIGLDVWGQEFAYAWVPYGDLGNTNYFSLVLRFGAPGEPHKNLTEGRENRSERSVRSSENPYSEEEDSDGKLMDLMLRDKSSQPK